MDSNCPLERTIVLSSRLPVFYEWRQDLAGWRNNVPPNGTSLRAVNPSFRLGTEGVVVPTRKLAQPVAQKATRVSTTAWSAGPRAGLADALGHADDCQSGWRSRQFEQLIARYPDRRAHQKEDQ